MPALRLGADIGGTFTDVVLLDPRTGRTTATKVLTTPDDPLRAVLAGLAEVLARSAGQPGDVAVVVHGTTLATNALIERQGAKTALLTTQGFRDVLETGRELRYDLYSLSLEYPRPLVPRRWRFPVLERIDAVGEVVVPLDVSQVERIADALEAEGIESVAICLLHSYADPSHERVIAAALRRRLPAVHVSASSDVLPQIGEYPRVSTTVVNAYVQPLMSTYLSRMAARLAGMGLQSRLALVASNGGMIGVADAVTTPAALIESGPAAGLTAAGLVAVATRRGMALAFDMGGTTAKLCLVRDGLPSWTSELEVARTARFHKGSGLPVALPSVDLIEIGAGGGSIARLDGLGLLEVGPGSAGSVPGPACYGRGGTAPTVTDANLLLGYLSPEYFVGGGMALSRAAAAASLEPIAGRLGQTIEATALNMFEAVTGVMANAARVHAAERGVDVRRSTIIAFGGAGPVHAWRIAQLLAVPSVIVPVAPGVLSALGCVLAPPRCDLARAFVSDLESVAAVQLVALAHAMRTEADRRLDQTAAAPRGRRYTWSLDMKYSGQRYAVNVPIRSVPDGPEAIPILRKAFQTEYRKRYGRTVPGVGIAVESLRLTAAGPAIKVARPAADLSSPPGAMAAARRPVWFGAAPVDTAVHRRADLGCGAALAGPAVIEDDGSTIIIPPGANAQVDMNRNVHIGFMDTIEVTPQ